MCRSEGSEEETSLLSSTDKVVAEVKSTALLDLGIKISLIP